MAVNVVRVSERWGGGWSRGLRRKEVSEGWEGKNNKDGGGGRE